MTQRETQQRLRKLELEIKHLQQVLGVEPTEEEEKPPRRTRSRSAPSQEDR